MSLPTFDWALVKSFLAVLDAGSLMGAARRLGAQQPTLSRHVAELEAQLGTPLFERTGRGVVPTAAALAIADAARQMGDGAETLARQLAGRRNATTGSVRITTSEVAAVWLLPGVLAELAAAEPGIQIELLASNALDNLLRREADIAVRMVQPAQASLVAKRIAEVSLSACASTAYLARRGRPAQPPDLLQHELIGYDQQDDLLRGFAAMGFPVTREHFALRTDDLIAAWEAVRAGLGVGFAADYTIDTDPAVQRILPMLPLPRLPIWLTVHREIRNNGRIRAVYDFLAQAIPLAL